MYGPDLLDIISLVQSDNIFLCWLEDSVQLSWFVRLGGGAFFILAYKVKLLHAADAALVAQLVARILTLKAVGCEFKSHLRQ